MVIIKRKVLKIITIVFVLCLIIAIIDIPSKVTKIIYRKEIWVEIDKMF